jgi:toxin ParE1/3/4
MSLPVAFFEEAEAEFDEAAAWYERRREGLGRDFVAKVQEVLDRICELPTMHPVVHKDVRRALVGRFPYAIFYRVQSEHVIVLSVFHTSRDPSVWKQRASD